MRYFALQFPENRYVKIVEACNALLINLDAVRMTLPFDQVPNIAIDRIEIAVQSL